MVALSVTIEYPESLGRVVDWYTKQTRLNKKNGIYIHPDFIGKKLGTRLITHALDILKEEGYTKATLWVLKTNKKTRKWYKRQGFKPDGKKKSDKRGEVVLRQLRYVKNLKQHAILLQWMKLKRFFNQPIMAN